MPARLPSPLIGMRWISRPAATLSSAASTSVVSSLLGLQHVVLQHVAELFQLLVPVAMQGHHALVGLLARQPVLRVERDRAAPAAAGIHHVGQPSPHRHLALDGRGGAQPRSDCTSATASLTGPSPKTCRTSAPLNLMLDCMSTPAAAISPSRLAHLGRVGARGAVAGTAGEDLGPGIREPDDHAAHRQAIEEELVEF